MRLPSRACAAGLVVGGLLTSALVAGCTSDDEPPSAATTITAVATVAPGPVAATELVAGDCVTGLVIGANERARIESASVVGCDQAHELEVFATFDLSPADFDAADGAYPGQQRVVTAADTGCGARSDALGAISEEIGVIAVWPTSQSWSAGDRAVACAAYAITGTLDDLTSS